MSSNAGKGARVAPRSDPFAEIGFSGPDSRTLLELERNWLNRFHEQVLWSYERTAQKILEREGISTDVVRATKRRQRAILGRPISVPLTEREARCAPASSKDKAGYMTFRAPFLWPAVRLLEMIEKSRELQYQRQFALMEKVDLAILQVGNGLFDAIQAVHTRTFSGKIAGTGKGGKHAPSTELIRRALIYDQARAESGRPWVKGRTQKNNISEALNLLKDEDTRNDISKATPEIGLTEFELDDDGCLRLSIDGHPAKPIKQRTLRNVPSRLKKLGLLDG